MPTTTDKELPNKVYIHEHFSKNRWSEFPSEGDLLYIQRDSLNWSPVYTNPSKRRGASVREPRLEYMEIEVLSNSTRLCVKLTDGAVRHLVVRNGCHSSDLANELRYFAGQLLT